ncbi:hypothetical protein P3J6_120905 [Pseudoalteromonas sp. 3J6]|nr:hypothetical protein P3J6_120905 [Pseudoalteromonas sp. 3J6]
MVILSIAEHFISLSTFEEFKAIAQASNLLSFYLKYHLLNTLLLKSTV